MSRTFSLPVSSSSTVAAWPVKPMLRRTAAGSFTMSCPPTRPVPLVGRERVVSMRTRVVLPAPLGPSSPSTEPCGIEKLTPPTATVSPKRLTRSMASTAVTAPETAVADPRPAVVRVMAENLGAASDSVVLGLCIRPPSSSLAGIRSPRTDARSSSGVEVKLFPRRSGRRGTSPTTSTPGEHHEEQLQAERGAPGSRDTGSDEPGGGPVDRPAGGSDEESDTAVNPQGGGDESPDLPTGSGG